LQRRRRQSTRSSIFWLIHLNRLGARGEMMIKLSQSPNGRRISVVSLLARFVARLRRGRPLQLIEPCNKGDRHLSDARAIWNPLRVSLQSGSLRRTIVSIKDSHRSPNGRAFFNPHPAPATCRVQVVANSEKCSPRNEH
jgi:hypothetical protein